MNNIIYLSLTHKTYPYLKYISTTILTFHLEYNSHSLAVFFYTTFLLSSSKAPSTGLKFLAALKMWPDLSHQSCHSFPFSMPGILPIFLLIASFKALLKSCLYLQMSWCTPLLSLASISFSWRPEVPEYPLTLHIVGYDVGHTKRMALVISVD